MLVDQKIRDDRIICLVGAMSDTLTFVEDAEPLKVIKEHIETVTLLLQQVTECGRFITEYAQQKDFCQSPPGSQWPPLISVTRDSDGKIHDL